MQQVGEFSYNYVLTGYGYGKEHLEKSRAPELSTSEKVFHYVIGNLERLFVIGALVGLAERVSIELYGKTAQIADDIKEFVLLFNFHGKVVTLVNNLYPEAKKNGICHGFALMGIHAILSGHVDGFNDRLKKLLSARAMADTSKDMIEKLQNDRDFDLLAFLEGMHVCHNLYPETKALLDPKTGPIDQHSKNYTETFLSMVASKELEAKGKIVKVNNQVRTGIYTEAMLSSYFSRLRESLHASPELQIPIAIQLSTIRAPHAISVGYDPIEKHWIFVDANNGYAEKITSDSSIAKKVMNGFNSSKLFGGRIAISHEIYAVNNFIQTETVAGDLETGSLKSLEIDLLEAKEADLYKSLSQNPREGWWYCNENKDWLYLAVREGDLVSVQNLITTAISLNVLLDEELTPLFHNSCNHLDVSLALIADPNFDPNRTPLNLFHDKDIDVAKALIAHPNFDPNRTSPSVFMNGNIDVAIALIGHPNFDPNRIPLFIFTNSDIAVAKALMEHPNFDPNRTLNSHLTDRNIDIAKALMEHPNFDPNRELLYLFTADRNLDIAKALMEHPNFDLHAKNDTGYTHFDLALLTKNLELAKILLEKKAPLGASMRTDLDLTLDAEDPPDVELLEIRAVALQLDQELLAEALARPL